MLSKPDDPLVRLQGLLPRAGQLQQSEDVGKNIRTLSAKLGRAEGRIDEFVSVCGAYPAFLRRESTEADSVLASLRDIEEIGRNIAEAETAEHFEQLVEFHDGDLGTIAEFNRGFQSHAREHLDRLTGPLRDIQPILQMLDEPLAPEVTSFLYQAQASVRVSISSLAEQMPSLCQTARSLKERLPNLGEQEDVRRFLDALRGRNATLDLLTPGVLAWLAERGALGRFVVSARGAG